MWGLPVQGLIRLRGAKFAGGSSTMLDSAPRSNRCITRREPFRRARTSRRSSIHLESVMPKPAPNLEQDRSSFATCELEARPAMFALPRVPLHRSRPVVGACIVVAHVALGVVGCSDAAEPHATESASATAVVRSAPQAALPALPAGLEIMVVSEEARPPVKRALDVMLSRKVSEPELRVVAAHIRAQDPRQYQRVFIFYHLPGMTPGSGAWASTFFEPELKVTILGTTSEEEAALKPVLRGAQEVIGCWVDDRAGAARVMTLVKVGGRIQMLQRFKDGSSIDAPLKESSHPDGRCFRDPRESHGDHFVLRGSGQLEIRDDQGLIVRLQPVK